MTRYLIIGNGIAGTTAAENIRKNDESGEITIVTDEKIPFYSRLRLNEYIAGSVTKDALIVRKEQWYEDKKIKLILDTRIESIDPQAKKVISVNGDEFAYDKLLYSAGSHAFIPPIEGALEDGVFALRDIEDANGIIDYSEGKKKVVLLGGGLLGLELGHALIEKGMEVTVVEFFPRLLPRQLDDKGGDCLQEMMEKLGFKFVLGRSAKQILSEDQHKKVVLDNGDILETDMVVISAGVRPNSTLIKDAGAEINLGVVIDETMKTSLPDVYAAGDLTERDGKLYGNWMISMEQGRLAAQSMTGQDVSYKGSIMSMILKVVGIDLGSAGEIDSEGAFESRVEIEDGFYRKIVTKGGLVCGCIMVGEKKGFQKIVKAINDSADISTIEELL